MNLRRLFLLLMLCLFAIGTTSALAQGMLQLRDPGAESIIIDPDPRHPIMPPPPRPTPFVRPPRPTPHQPAELVKLEAKVEIDDLVARTSIDQSFRNPNNVRLEGVYLFPLPPNAAVKDLSLYIDGKPVKAEVLEAVKAKKIYEDIVRSMRDPALLEYVGTDLVQLRIFPIEPGQTRRVQFQYSQVMKREFGLCGYTLPLVPTNAAAQPIKELVVSGEIKSSVPLASLYSPTHAVDFVKKDGGKSAKFSLEANGKVPESNLKIYIGVSEKEVGAGFTAYRKDADGYFLLVLSPRDETKDNAPLPKDVVFVLDTSGSMSGEKIKQAKKSLEYCLNALHPKDRFNIIRFSTETEPFAKELTEVSDKTRKDALEFVNKFDAAGGTAIDAALKVALKSNNVVEERYGRPSLIVFLTDGMPTVGETNIENIEKEFTKQNTGHVRLFTFGIGNDVNTKLLDKLADNNGGAADYILPNEDIEVKVSNFFAKVSSPVLTQVKLAYGDAEVFQAYPTQLRDLFAGQQITVIGRYKKPGKTTLVLSGERAGKQNINEYPVEFPESADAADFLPRLWAMRRAGHLVDEIHKNGENKELVDEVTQLGKQYAIATPYTSLLVVEDTPQMRARVQTESLAIGYTYDSTNGSRSSGDVWRNVDGGARPSAVVAPSATKGSVSRVQSDMRSLRTSIGAFKADTGADAVQNSQATRQLKESAQRQASQKLIRQLARRSYEQQGVKWVDTQYDGKAKLKDVAFGSDEYFALLKKDKEIAKILALGQNVIFEWEGTWYQIVDKETATP